MSDRSQPMHRTYRHGRMGPPFLGIPIVLALIIVAIAWHTQGPGAGRFMPFILVIIAIGVALFGYVTGRFNRRLERLRQAVESLNLKDLSSRVPEMGHDSVGALAEAFNRMASRLEAEEKSRRNLFADVAHELRHPLAVIRGRLESIQDGVVPMDTEQLLLVEDDVIALSRLVDDLRDLSLAEVGQLRLESAPVNLGELLGDLLADLSPVAEERGVQLSFSVGADVPVIQADAARIRQVLVNLLTNALRHTPQGGSVTLGARREGSSVLLAVADTGEGVPPERLPHIFERFYRADGARSRATGGTGLGLAIAKSLVELHGGRVEATSAPGHGATFSVRLPAGR